MAGRKEMIPTSYRFGCEPYLLVSRRFAPRYDESFVGYGKDRVAFTYELAARGVSLRVQPHLFLVHYTTVQRGKKYGHAPSDWMLGETCWPEFRERIRKRYNYQIESCAQMLTDQQVARAHALNNETMPRCVSASESLCVGACGPEVAFFGTSGTTRRNAAKDRSHSRLVTAGPHQTLPRLNEPTVFVLGCDGCGTVAVKSYLDLLSGFSFGRRIEGERWWDGESPQYFSQEDRYARGDAWYRAHYSGSPITTGTSNTSWIDASSYLSSPFAAARIKARLAAHALHHRFLLVLRDPAELAWVLWQRRSVVPRRESAYGTIDSVLHGYFEGHNFTSKVAREVSALTQCFRANQKQVSFNLVVSIDAWTKCVATACGWDGCVVGAGLFSPQIRTWRLVYPSAQISVFTLNELREQSGGAANRIHRLLAVPSQAGWAHACSAQTLQRMAVAVTREASGSPKVAMDVLQSFFSRLSQQLRDELVLMGEDLSRWSSDNWLWADEMPRQRMDEADGEATAPIDDPGRSAARLQELAVALGEGYILPKLYLLGCEKCGSTSLAFALSRHPQMRFARRAASRLHVPTATRPFATSPAAWQAHTGW